MTVTIGTEQLLPISWMQSTSCTVVPLEITHHNETRKIH